MTDLLTLEEAETIVGEPATTWVSRCYEIAHKLAPEVGGEAVYGHWCGTIAPRTHFASCSGTASARGHSISCAGSLIFRSRTSTATRQRSSRCSSRTTSGAWIPLDNQIAAGVAGNDDEFICERCGEDIDDTSFQPLCPDCHHETEGRR